MQLCNSEPIIFFPSRKVQLQCRMCRCAYPSVCICLCVCSCFINLLLRFNLHWIINIWRRLNSEDFHRVNTLNLRAGFYFLLLCKQFKAVKYVLKLPNTCPRTCHILINFSIFQPDHRYSFQPRTAYSYHLPQPFFFLVCGPDRNLFQPEIRIWEK